VDPQIFITYSSKDQKVARTICAALESRGLACWISSRNVKPGQNYQEQIVKAIRAAKIMVLVFTANANNSNEIKKELALASQNDLVVIPVRIEDIIPNEAFAYEFATRQWIDLFENWEDSIAQLVEMIASTLQDHQSGDRTAAASPSRGYASPAIKSSDPVQFGNPAPVKSRSAWRWASAATLAAVVATVAAYGLVFLPQQHASVAVGVSTNAPGISVTPSPTPKETPPPSPVTEPPVQAIAPSPNVPVAPTAQAPAIQPAQTQPTLAPPPQQPQQQSSAAVSTASSPSVSAQAPQAAPSATSEAERAWAVTKDTTSVAVLQAFIRQFGPTAYGNMARARLKELQTAAVKTTPQVAMAAPAETDALPNMIQLSEHNFGMSWSVTLHKTGSNTYGGTYNHGYVTKFTMITFTKDIIKMERADAPALGAVSGTYAGQRNGNSATGTCDLSNGFSPKWEASW
jgi:hypothetical protein